MFLTQFDVICDLLLNRRTAKCNLFLLYKKETNVANDDVIYASIA